MQAYVYNAALLCERCAKIEIEDLTEFGRQDRGDSDTFPQGPYANGGGPADTPQHCDKCGMFLENPLTADGINYTRDMLRRANPMHPHGAILDWAEFYGALLCYCPAIAAEISSGDCDHCLACHYRHFGVSV